MELNQFFKSIVDQDTAPIVICDVDHIIVYMNDVAAKRYEKAGGADMVGRSIMDCHSAKTQDVMRKILAWFMESTDNNIVYEGPGTNENKDVYMVALRDGEGEVIGYYEKHEYHDVETNPMFWPVIDTSTSFEETKPLFFPGCKVKPVFPKEYERLMAFLGDVEETGCCRTYYAEAAPDRPVIYVCNNCHEILKESGTSHNLLSVWELIDADEDFSFPDYGGKEMALQDCWIATGNHKAHDAIRSIMGKMNIRAVETAANRDDSRFCGSNLLVPASERNKRLAPERWIKCKDEQTTLLDESLWGEHFKRQCEDIPTQEVACYCTFCSAALEAGGKTPVHLLQLLFPK